MNQNNLKRIFIVDDDPFWTAMLSQMLHDLGYEYIKEYSNGTECLDHLHLNPHLIFLDYQMGDDMNGLEVLQKVKDYYPGIGVVFCTALEDLSVAVNAISFGSFDYLLKSNANPKEVAEIVKKVNHHKTATSHLEIV
jgi:DNA-binding NtrC family response regulator